MSLNSNDVQIDTQTLSTTSLGHLLGIVPENIHTCCLEKYFCYL